MGLNPPSVFVDRKYQNVCKLSLRCFHRLFNLYTLPFINNFLDVPTGPTQFELGRLIFPKSTISNSMPSSAGIYDLLLRWEAAAFRKNTLTSSMFGSFFMDFSKIKNLSKSSTKLPNRMLYFQLPVCAKGCVKKTSRELLMSENCILALVVAVHLRGFLAVVSTVYVCVHVFVSAYSLEIETCKHVGLCCVDTF